MCYCYVLHIYVSSYVVVWKYFCWNFFKYLGSRTIDKKLLVLCLLMFSLKIYDNFGKVKVWTVLNLCQLYLNSDCFSKSNHPKTNSGVGIQILAGNGST